MKHNMITIKTKYFEWGRGGEGTEPLGGGNTLLVYADEILAGNKV